MVRPIPMDIEEFDLLIRSIHRAHSIDKTCIGTGTDHDSIFFTDKNVTNKASSPFDVHIFRAHSGWWVTMRNTKYEYSFPGFFSFKEKARYKKLEKLIADMQGRNRPPSVEQLICETIPCAKELIAERSLIGDNKD